MELFQTVPLILWLLIHFYNYWVKNPLKKSQHDILLILFEILC